jgi:hypothetical protein
MKIILNEDEMISARTYCVKHYPGCFSSLRSYDSFFTWERTRQGHSYWESKLEDETWMVDKDNSRYSEALAKNLTYSDKVYMSLLAFSRQHNIKSFDFSPGVTL